MSKKIICDMDCLNCKFEDCINDREIADIEDYDFAIDKTPKQMLHIKQHKAKVDRALSTGLCMICNKNPHKENMLWCTECSEKYKTFRKEQHQQGLCHCGRPLAEGKKRCERCLETARLYTQKIYYQRIKAHQCVKCGKSIDNGFSMCADCMAKDYARKKKCKEKKAKRLQENG